MIFKWEGWNAIYLVSAYHYFWFSPQVIFQEWKNKGLKMVQPVRNAWFGSKQRKMHLEVGEREAAPKAAKEVVMEAAQQGLWEA